jgi:hypothetical protein
MPTSNRSVFRRCSRVASVTNRTAVYGPVRTVVWQGSAGDRRPYADLTRSNAQIGQVTWPSLTESSRKYGQELASDIDTVEDFDVGNLSPDYVNEQHSFGCV